MIDRLHDLSNLFSQHLFSNLSDDINNSILLTKPYLPYILSREQSTWNDLEITICVYNDNCSKLRTELQTNLGYFYNAADHNEFQLSGGKIKTIHVCDFGEGLISPYNIFKKSIYTVECVTMNNKCVMFSSPEILLDIENKLLTPISAISNTMEVVETYVLYNKLGFKLPTKGEQYGKSLLAVTKNGEPIQYIAPNQFINGSGYVNLGVPSGDWGQSVKVKGVKVEIVPKKIQEVEKVKQEVKAEEFVLSTFENNVNI